MLGLLTGLGLLELWHLIYPRLLTVFGMLVFFTNLSLMEFQVRYLALFLLFSVIDIFESLNWLLNLNLIYKTQWTGVRSGLLISVLGKLSWFRLTGLITNNGSIDVQMGGSILEEKSYFKMLGLTFSSKLDWGSYIISNAKTASKKIGVLIRSMKFLSPDFALYIYKSTICPCMEYCCHVWAGAPSCYLDLLDKLQKWICRIVGPSLAASLEPLAHC